MPHYIKYLPLTLAFFLSVLAAEKINAQSVSPVFYVETEDGEEEQTSYAGSAPLKVRFEAKTEDLDEYSVNYEWNFYSEGDTTAYMTRYGETTEYTFNSAGQHKIILHARYNDGISDVDVNNEEDPLIITISESQIDFPNAFSPNGDGINDTFKAKAGAKSIVELNAAIYNRWGQMVFKFRDINDEWDGTYKGHPVKDGVYFLNCDAKGADGRHFRIRKDVNILRGYTESQINN
ncbi:MAG: gliding motility-associated C-terminal domain-containing protein [Bacteroidaceae bacterium]|nr:gliding motility-associated C-terminal domain-containing protein [Bacteroidaceae bacterium]